MHNSRRHNRSAAIKIRVGVVAALLLAFPACGVDDPPPLDRKLIVVLFGGGTRSAETVDDASYRHIPRLGHELIPRGTLFTNLRVEGKVVHPNCAGSIVTGFQEWDDLDWSRPVAHPTIFELFRQTRHAPDTAAWAFVYASILAKLGESRAAGFGSDYGANVVEPPTIPRAAAEQMSRRMARAAATGSAADEREAARRNAELARESSRIATGGVKSADARRFLDAQYADWKRGTGTTSHDAFLTECALACMKQFAPGVLVVALGEIDCAHYGSWSRYAEAIRRTDELTCRLWRAAEDLPAYRGRTLLLVLPDHGRELDRPGGLGFIHHSDFYTGAGADEGCRRVWMLALGPGVAAGRTVTNAVASTAAAATGLEFLGLATATGASASVWREMGRE